MVEKKYQISDMVQSHELFLRFLIELAVQILDVKAASLILFDKDQNKLFFTMVSEGSKSELKRIDLELDEGIAGWVYQNKRSVFVPDVRSDERWSSRIADSFDLSTKSLACAPLLYNDKALGVLEVIDMNDGSPLTARSLKQLEILAELISDSLAKTIRLSDAELEIKKLKENEKSKYRIIGKSAAIEKAIKYAKMAAPSNATALITGESGTGKELFAHLIHAESSRANKPMVKVNCGAFPETLLERELFGNEKGAYTGADRMSPGIFEAADKGTIFLDEIAETSFSMQVKLLRVLQDGSFLRVGGTQLVKVDVRVIAATNKDLKELINLRKFREDLYYRLNVIHIELPPIRERGEDIKLIADHALLEIKTKLAKPDLNFSEAAVKLIMNYDWPGNVRQLYNAIERAAILCDRKLIYPSDLPSDISPKSGIAFKKDLTLKDAQNQFRRLFIQETLNLFNNNQTKAARSLGIQRTYLSKVIKEFGLSTDEES